MFKHLLILLTVLLCSQLYGQNDTIQVPFNGTTVLLFPDSIAFDDIGSPKFQASKKVNRYLIYSKITDPKYASSLYIELPSGHYYQFILVYREVPSKNPYIFTYEDAQGVNKIVRTKIVEQKVNADTVVVRPIESKKVIEEKKANNQLADDCQTAFSRPDIYSSLGIVSGNVTFWLNSIYVKDDKLFIKLTANNRSSFNYDVSKVRFSISNKQATSKKSTVADQELNVLYTYNETEVVKGKTEHAWEFALDKFTISSKKFLYIELWEKNGERDLKFRVSAKELLQAKQLR